MNDQKIRLVLADDQALFAESLKSVLESSSRFVLLGIAGDGRTAVEMVRQLHPDIAILDVRMPIMDGVEAAGIIRKKYPAVKVVMLTTFPDDEYVHEALKLGAHGYLLKDISINLLIKSLESVAEGAVLLSPQISGHFTSVPSRTRMERQVPDRLRELTEREMEILTLIARGYGNHEIEQALNLGKQTIRNYISSIYSKIDVKDRFEAMRIGIESGLPETEAT